MKAETSNEYNPWAYLPLHLSPQEIKTPLSVIAAFFDDDRLPGQLAMLKAWREFVLKPDYYRGPKNSPSALLYFHKLNIALIEAMYLLHQSGATDKLNLSSDELAKEKNSWTVYPVFFSTSELHEPFLFLQSFFAAYSLPQYREQLAAWLEHGLSCRRIHRYSRVDYRLREPAKALRSRMGDPSAGFWPPLLNLTKRKKLQRQPCAGNGSTRNRQQHHGPISLCIRSIRTPAYRLQDYLAE